MAIQADSTPTPIPPTSSAVAVPDPQTSRDEIIEAVITAGNLARLTVQERTRYYVEVCRSVGLNPLTKPLEYITIDGKLTLYALRNATDQLRAIHGVSIEELTETERDGVFVVTAKVRNREGRTDVAKGAVAIGNLEGAALANAMMRCESKAKRRATLSLCGLGFLDETELDTVPAATIARPAPVLVNPPVASVPAPVPAPAIADPPHDPETGVLREDLRIGPHTIALPPAKTEWQKVLWWGSSYIAAIGTATTLGEIGEWQERNAATLDRIRHEVPKVYDRIEVNIAAAQAKLASEDADPMPPIPAMLDRRRNGGPRLVRDEE